MVHQVDRDGNTGLHAAAAMNHVAVVKYLLGKGANPNSQNYNGYTALHWAIENNAIDVAKLLLVDIPKLLKETQSDQQRARKLAAGDISELRHQSSSAAAGGAHAIGGAGAGSQASAQPAAPSGAGYESGGPTGMGSIAPSGRSGRPTGGARLMAAGAIDRPSTRPVPPGVAPPTPRSVGLGVPRGRGGRGVMPSSSTAVTAPAGLSAGAGGVGGGVAGSRTAPALGSAGAAAAGEAGGHGLTGSQMQLIGGTERGAEAEEASMIDVAGRVVVDPAVRNSEGVTPLRMVSFLKEKHQGPMRELFKEHRLLTDPDFAAAEAERAAAEREARAKAARRGGKGGRGAQPLGASKRPSVY